MSGGRALFGGMDMGAVVPFVLWFNFTAGFAYILAGFGLWRRTRWAHLLSFGIALATIAVFTAFLSYIWQGGAYELRTIGAMVVRTLVWTLIAAIAIKSRRLS